MTVKELKEKLNQLPDNCIVCIPDSSAGYTLVENVTHGVNEFDGLVFIDDYVEDD